jgi:hypothetical protein
MTRLFHFSDDPAIEAFVPRPVRAPSVRLPGRAWLNGPLVWAIEAQRQYLYLFPRDCPRVVVWATPHTSPADRARWIGASVAPDCAVAYVEEAWLERCSRAVLYRYELPVAAFRNLEDAGMWVSCEIVAPLAVERMIDLPAALGSAGAELRVLPSLAPLRNVWDSSVHASGIRLRNAAGWAT